MNILHLSGAVDWRGGEQQVLYLAEELNLIKEVQQIVLCPAGSVLEKKLKEKKVPVQTFSKGAFHHFTFASQIKRICVDSKIDLIHIHDAHSHTGAVLSAVLFGNQTPMVLSRRVDFPVKPNWFSKCKYNYKNIKSIICVSNAVKKILQPDIHNKKIQFAIIYDGIDVTRFQNKPSGYIRNTYKIPSDTLLIGNVAAIASHKDYYTFVDTAEVLIKKNINTKFIIIGDGPEKENITAYINQKNLQAHIIMTGFVKNVENVLPELDIFLFTSKTEGLGSSILDAYLSKVPVVSTRAGGVPEIVKHNETGLLADVKKPDQLAEQIIQLINNKELTQKLKLNAEKYVQQFSKQNTALQALTEYKKYLPLK